MRGFRSGFTLVELLVSLVVLSVFSTAMYGFYRSQVFALRLHETQLDVKESAEAGLEYLVREVRMAGARPLPEAYPPAGCSVAAESSISVSPRCCGFSAISTASGSSISFRYDYRGNAASSAPDGCPDDPHEAITYAYNPGTNTVSRTANGTSAPIITNVAPNGFRFRYYRLDGTELQSGGGSLTGIERVRDVASIVATLTTSQPNPDRSVGGNVTSMQTSTIHLRNPLCMQTEDRNGNCP